MSWLSGTGIQVKNTCLSHFAATGAFRAFLALASLTVSLHFFSHKDKSRGGTAILGRKGLLVIPVYFLIKNYGITRHEIRLIIAFWQSVHISQHISSNIDLKNLLKNYMSSA